MRTKPSLKKNTNGWGFILLQKEEDIMDRIANCLLWSTICSHWHTDELNYVVKWRSPVDRNTT